jgi:DNA modification methylase
MGEPASTPLTTEQEMAYRLADNKLAETDVDMGLVIEELKELEELGELAPLTGYDTDLTIEPDEADDEVPEVPEEPRSKLGDLYELGEHRVLCGNATELNDVELALGGKKPDLVHTDPPYGMNAVTKSGVLSANYGTDILGDDNPDVAKDSFNLIYGLLPDAKHIWWGANYYSSVLPDSECWLVWDKNNGESDQTDCELAWANFRSVVRQFTQASEKTNRVHPTQKPVTLMGWILKRFRHTAEIVFDPFLGSGSTLIAAEKAKCKCVGMELDPRFVDVIVQRYVDYVDNPVVKLNGEVITWNKTPTKSPTKD